MEPTLGANSRIGLAGRLHRPTCPWLRALLLGAVLAATQSAAAADIGADEGAALPSLPATSIWVALPSMSTESAPPPAAASGSAAATAAVARDLETAPPRRALVERAPGRMGLHVVMRVALVDVVSHPDSGSLNVALRSRLLGRPIARAPLALGLAWRF